MKKIPQNEINFDPTSYVDPNGRVFVWKNDIYRAIHKEKVAFYKGFMEDGFFSGLMEKGLLVETEITPLELVRRLSTNPARILARPGGSLAVGAVADVVVVDPERRWTYDPSKGYSKSRNSPWAGKTLEGRAVATIVEGRLVYHVDRGVLMP